MVARIYKPAKTAAQSGQAITKNWVLDFAQEKSQQVEPLMGWTSSSDMHANFENAADVRSVDERKLSA